jgi:DNA-binding HxlR family transcriptional regulator
MKQSAPPFRSTWKGNDRCPYKAALDVVGGRWKGLLIWRLSVEPLRTGELRKLIPDITQKMLTQQLRALENEGVVARTVYPEVPPKVVYRLTDYGRSVVPVVMGLTEWGNAHVERRQTISQVPAT